MRLWRNPRLLQDRTYPRKLVSLASYMRRSKMGCQDYVRVAVGLLKCLDILHDQDLIQDNLSVEDVRLDTSDTVLPNLLLYLHV